jgi:hypothetical protein
VPPEPPETSVGMLDSMLNPNEMLVMPDSFHDQNSASMANEPDLLGNQTNVKVNNSGIAQLPGLD